MWWGLVCFQALMLLGVVNEFVHGIFATAVDKADPNFTKTKAANIVGLLMGMFMFLIPLIILSWFMGW